MTLDHLRGKHVVGVYPMLPDDTCWFVAADFDDAGWQEDVLAYARAARSLGLDVAVERSRSGNGAHDWLFFAEPVPAAQARVLATHLLSLAMRERPSMTLASYDRLFPSQDFMPKGGFGNLIALPLQLHARDQGNSVFVDDALLPHADPWCYLQSLRRIPRTELKAAAGSWSRHPAVARRSWWRRSWPAWVGRRWCSCTASNSCGRGANSCGTCAASIDIKSAPWPVDATCRRG